MKNNVIEVTPDKDGKLFIKMFGTRYEIKIKDVKKIKASKEKVAGE